MPRRYPILALCFWLAVGSAVAALSTGAMRAGLWGGWLTSGVAGACTFAALDWSMNRPLPAVLKAAAAGFLVRLLLLVVGVLLTVHGGGSPVGFTVAFFAVYLICQGIEAVALYGHPQARSEARP
jgi:hypothetical protein